MKITAADLLRLGVIHRIVYEPTGLAHGDRPGAIKRLSLALGPELDGLKSLSPAELKTERRNFFLQLGRLPAAP